MSSAWWAISGAGPGVTDVSDVDVQHPPAPTPVLPDGPPHPDGPPPHGPRVAFTRAQLMDLQGDLMIWCPELKPAFVNGVDPETGVREVADNGARPWGVINGWVWTLFLPFYAKGRRQILYDKVKSYGFTHVAIQMTKTAPGGGYHGLRPVTAAECDAIDRATADVHDELLDNGLIPICAGVAPGPAARGGAAINPRFDGRKALVAMSDWDNTGWAAGRIKTIAEAFPNALLYFERPHNPRQPQPDIDPDGVDPVPPTAVNGGQWLAAMRRLYPNFVGVLYEVNHPDGLAKCRDELTMAHAWWRDIQEVRFEIDTYWKFWENLSKETADQFNADLQAACPWLSGFMSGGPTHPPLPDDSGRHEEHGAAGDMIDPATITFVAGPNLGAFPRTATLTRVDLRLTGVHVEFDRQRGPGRWPDTPNLESRGGMGPLQYSLGMALRIRGRWYASAPIEFWYGLDENGGQIQAQNVDRSGAGQIPKNWFYSSRWSPMNGYQPAPGEEIGLFVCAGDARNGVFVVRERSNIVRVPLPKDGQAMTFTWNA